MAQRHVPRSTRGENPERPQPLTLGYARGRPFQRVDVRLHEPHRRNSAPGSAILAVIADDDLDASVTDLSRDLAHALHGPLCIVRPVRLPAALPVHLSREALATLVEAPLDVLEPATETEHATMLLARQIGPALVAEAAARHCAAIVIGAAPVRGLAGWRKRRTMRYLTQYAACRVYVVQAASRPTE